MRSKLCFNGLSGKKEKKILRKRPMCWAAIGFLLIISIFLCGRSYDEVLYQMENGKVFLKGEITEKQYKESSYGGYWQVVLKNVSVEQKRELEILEGKYLCRISTVKEEEFKIGQQILLEGSYTAWETPANPGQFDAGKYYCSLGILGQFKKCRVLEQGNSYSEFGEKMWKFRQKVCTFLIKELGENDGTLICAMLLGEKSGLDEENKNLYQRNGISHILAISGLHLTLLGTGIVRSLKVILGGNKRVSIFSILIMSLYCVFTGNSISTIRATIMFALSLIAGMVGRSYDSLSALGLAAILQLFINPYVLNNSGFLLSFLAVIGVTFIAPKLQEILGAERKFSKSLCVSLAASVTTLPVLLGNYGVYPWYSIILNLFIIPFMSVLLFLAVMLVLLILLSQASVGCSLLVLVENYVVLGIKIILKYFELCCKIFEQIGFQDGYIGSPSILQIVIYIILVAVAISGIVKHSMLGRKMLLVSAIGILTMNTNFGTEVTMLDVGQGDCIVIHNANGNVYISDCGSSSISQVGKYRLLPYLKHKGYGRIKGIFISHLDEDHRNGIVELLELASEEKIKIEYLFLPKSVLEIEEDRKIAVEMQKLAKQNGIKVIYLTQGDRISDGNIRFYCLYPKCDEKQANTVKDRNNESLVLLMKYRDFDMLLTGDIEKQGELELLKYIEQRSSNIPKEFVKKYGLGDGEPKDILKEHNQDDYLRLDVLKVAHHGSSGSSCKELLKVLNPKLSLISCGKNNSYGHPHEETLERLEEVGSNVMSTVESGAITIKIGKKIKVYGFKK